MEAYKIAYNPYLSEICRIFFSQHVPKYLKIIEEKENKEKRKDAEKALDLLVIQYTGNDKPLDKTFFEEVLKIHKEVANYKSKNQV